MAWTGFMCLRLGPAVGCCAHCNEHSGSIKCGKYLTGWELVASLEVLSFMELAKQIQNLIL
jgi:hypothetical protein